MILIIISPVAVHVEAPVQGHHPDRLLLARGGHDGVAAHGAPGSKPPVKILNKVRVKYLSFIETGEDLLPQCSESDWQRPQ